MWFSQYKPSTQYLGYPCNLTDTPHYQFVLDNDPKGYKFYLEQSWKDKPYTKEDIKKKIAEFRELKRIIIKYGIKEPITATNGFDGETLIVHGNHRASIALAKDIDIPMSYQTLESYLQDCIMLARKRRFGTNLGEVPYQSIFYKGKEIVQGRRRDTLSRQELIGRLDNKVVVDFGCNYGASSALAVEYGADYVIGLEFEKDIATSACRLNGLFNYPVFYIVQDLSMPVELSRKGDVGFVFSIDIHIKNNETLAQNIKNNVSELVFFECHEGKQIPKEIADIFDTIEHIGTNETRRKMYKCYLKH